MEHLLKLTSVTKTFSEGDHHTTVLKDIDLTVKKGEFLMLLGPSGSGKSTLLRIMTGLIEASSGKVEIEPNIKQALIFQNFALFPWLSVIDNIEFGLKMAGMVEHERRRLAEAEIELMGLKGFENHYPRELSGGMKQRVGIARALVMSPDIVFLDEPFSALDSFTSRKLRADLLKIWEERKFTLVMVTHLIEEALEMGDRIAVLTNRPARVERIFQVTLARPRDKRSPSFFEQADTIADTIKVD